MRWLPGAGVGLFLGLVIAAARALAQEPVLGDYWAHDPSTIVKCGDRYYVYRTAQGIMAKYSTDLRNWVSAGRVFAPGAIPAWTTNAAPGFDGTIWAPDVIQVASNRYFLYYSVSSWGSQASAIGLATNATLDPAAPGYAWVDQGPVIQSRVGDPYNCIDPCVFMDTNGTMWLTFGSYWNGIHIVQLDPATGKRINTNSLITRLASYSGGIEASCLFRRGQYYYLFVNWGQCCDGVASTYEIRVGRSKYVTGPYLDRNGVNMVNGRGTLLLESTGRFIGPGHAGIFREGDTYWFSYHYYDGNNNGTATLGLARLGWTADDWPALTNDWSAFYPLETDARDTRGQFPGTLRNGAALVPEPDRGRVLSLDGTNQFVSLPAPVANAGTVAAWVKWNGGGDWQRIFDFGDGTNRYLFLTPRAANGRMRFAITTSGSGAEQRIDAPWACPTGAWCHVAVTLDGSRGLLYLNGEPVATNSSLTLRPWRVQARSNYLGRSQWPDPLFQGRLDSVRIFGRALAPDEIRLLARAHPALAHRYRFADDARDDVGMAHGRLLGGAAVTNGVLVLNGVPGCHVDLPGGLVSGAAAVTIEFWASFGPNGNWARVFDFGDIAGAYGARFLFFSPHTPGGQRLGLTTDSGTANLDLPGTLDGRSLHVACVVDPASGYSALFTNGTLRARVSQPIPALSGVGTNWAFLGRSLFSADPWLNATIDEFRVYAGALTPAELAVNAAAGPDALALPVALRWANSAAGLNLSWPSYALGFLPEETDLLAPATAWRGVSAAAVRVGDRWQLTVQPTNSSGFIRLRR